MLKDFLFLWKLRPEYNFTGASPYDGLKYGWISGDNFFTEIYLLYIKQMVCFRNWITDYTSRLGTGLYVIWNIQSTEFTTKHESAFFRSQWNAILMCKRLATVFSLWNYASMFIWSEALLLQTNRYFKKYMKHNIKFNLSKKMLN